MVVLIDFLPMPLWAQPPRTYVLWYNQSIVARCILLILATNIHRRGSIMPKTNQNDRLQTDQDLIQACRAGDAQAWERLLDKYERLVFSISLNHGLTTDDAADITQITFTIFLQNLDSL